MKFMCQELVPWKSQDHLMFLNCEYPHVTETLETKTTDKETYSTGFMIKYGLDNNIVLYSVLSENDENNFSEQFM